MDGRFQGKPSDCNACKMCPYDVVTPEKTTERAGLVEHGTRATLRGALGTASSLATHCAVLLPASRVQYRRGRWTSRRTLLVLSIKEVRCVPRVRGVYGHLSSGGVARLAFPSLFRDSWGAVLVWSDMGTIGNRDVGESCSFPSGCTPYHCRVDRPR